MITVRSMRTGVHAALIGLAIPYVWLNIGLLTSRDGDLDNIASVVSAVGWIILFAIVVYMSKRDGADPFAFDWKDRIPLACAFMHGTATNHTLRRDKAYDILTLVPLIPTALFGILCVAAIVLDLAGRNGDDDADEGLVLDGGEEGALTLTESSTVTWPTYFNARWLVLYRANAALSLFALSYAVMRVFFVSVSRVPKWIAIVTFTLASVPLILCVRGPWDGSGASRYYALTKATLAAVDFAALAFLGFPSRTPRRQNWEKWMYRIVGILVLLPPLALLGIVVQHDRRYPDEDAEGCTTAAESHVLFDPDAEEV